MRNFKSFFPLLRLFQFANTLPAIPLPAVCRCSWNQAMFTSLVNKQSVGEYTLTHQNREFCVAHACTTHSIRPPKIRFSSEHNDLKLRSSKFQAGPPKYHEMRPSQARNKLRTVRDNCTPDSCRSPPSFYKVGTISLTWRDKFITSILPVSSVGQSVVLITRMSWVQILSQASILHHNLHLDSKFNLLLDYCTAAE